MFNNKLTIATGITDLLETTMNELNTLAHERVTGIRREICANDSTGVHIATPGNSGGEGHQP